MQTIKQQTANSQLTDQQRLELWEKEAKPGLIWGASNKGILRYSHALETEIRARISAETKDQLDEMVKRFLGWKLPQSFGPDCFISFDRVKALANNSWPIGTNVFTAEEAYTLFKHALTEQPK